MRGDFDPLQRREDAASAIRRPSWCPARGDVLAVLSAESVRQREAEAREEAARCKAEGTPLSRALLAIPGPSGV